MPNHYVKMDPFSRFMTKRIEGSRKRREKRSQRRKKRKTGGNKKMSALNF